jgi:hypothetical protein
VHAVRDRLQPPLDRIALAGVTGITYSTPLTML